MNVELYFINIWFLVFSSSYVIEKNAESEADSERHAYIVFPNYNVPVNEDSWTCGLKFSQWFSYEFIASSCAEKSPEMNVCCANHDKCYEFQMGQDVCDKQFCDCLDRAHETTYRMGLGCFQKVVPPAMCKSVEWFGSDAYESSVGVHHEHSNPVHPAVDKKTIQAFSELYKSCRKIDLSLSSCAYNHNVCFVQFLPNDRYKQEYSDCNAELIYCLKNSVNFLMKNDEICKKGLDQFLEAMEKNEIKVAP